MKTWKTLLDNWVAEKIKTIQRSTLKNAGTISHKVE